MILCPRGDLHANHNGADGGGASGDGGDVSFVEVDRLVEAPAEGGGLADQAVMADELPRSISEVRPNRDVPPSGAADLGEAMPDDFGDISRLPTSTVSPPAQATVLMRLRFVGCASWSFS
jgi:hypothetical protein